LSFAGENRVGQIAQGQMWSFLVVMASPFLDALPGVDER
jgi:hypothetical protein